MLSDHNHDNKTCGIYRVISAEKRRKEGLAEFARFLSGKGQDRPNVGPVLPMNRYRFGVSSRVKAASRISPPRRIVLHPERIERSRRLAELYRFINPEGWSH